MNRNKKIARLAVTSMMVMSMGITAMASGLQSPTGLTNPASQNTPVKYSGIGTNTYEVSVPSLLRPTESGVVTLTGTWASNKAIEVTTTNEITVTNDIDGGQKVLNVGFNDIYKAGDNTLPISVTEKLSVEAIKDALFGTWDGTIEFNIKMNELVAGCYDAAGNLVNISVDFESDGGIADILNANGVKKVVIPYGTTKIGENKFAESNITEVYIPETVTTIKGLAFQQCNSLTHVYMPDSVTSMGWFVFLNCPNVKTMRISKGLSSLDLGVVPGNVEELIIPSGVTHIAGSAMQNNPNLKYVELPDTLIEIAGWSFNGCVNLEELYIPDSVTNIGVNAFDSATHITYNGPATDGDLWGAGSMN